MRGELGLDPKLPERNSSQRQLDLLAAGASMEEVYAQTVRETRTLRTLKGVQHGKPGETQPTEAELRGVLEEQLRHITSNAVMCPSCSSSAARSSASVG